jgi:homoisocitrate dehydrogenase
MESARYEVSQTPFNRLIFHIRHCTMKEVVPEGKKVLEAVASLSKGALQFDFIELDAGWGTFQRTGHALPSSTVAELRKCHGALFGAVSSPSHKVAGYSSPIVQMRKELDLYANLRPCTSVPALKTPGSRENVDLLIVRENTEDLYVKREKMHKDPVLGDVAIAEKQISEKASTRIARVAFQQASTRTRVQKKDPLVTIVHKSNVLSLSDGLFRECALKVAKEFPAIKFEEQIVDSMLLKMIQYPERYDVIVAPNLYGDILSDGAAAFGTHSNPPDADPLPALTPKLIYLSWRSWNCSLG